EHGFVDAVAGQGTEAGEPWLVLELKCPCECAREVHAVAPREIQFPREAGSRVTGVHRSIPITQLRSLTRGAAFGVGFTDDHGDVFQLGIGGDSSETAVNGAQVRGDTHAYVVVGEDG